MTQSVSHSNALTPNVLYGQYRRIVYATQVNKAHVSKGYHALITNATHQRPLVINAPELYSMKMAAHTLLVDAFKENANKYSH